MRLQGKSIIVTGAAGGMGMATAHRLIEEGATVIGIDLFKDGVPKIESSFIPFAADLTNEHEVASVFHNIDKMELQINGLVNIAGIAQKALPVEEVQLSEWKRLIDINAMSIFLTSKEAVKRMKKQKHGSIVNVASISAVRPRPGLQAYIASKGAVVSFTKALAIELAPFKIRANVIHPGPCDTKMLAEFIPQDSDVEQIKDEVFKKSVPMGDLVNPIDVANAVLFLCSDESKMVTGTILHVDGGRGL
jgi:3-oxoacyl-[acyl-carrier protein] reductase